MSDSSPALFTVAQIAAALKRRPQSIRQGLADASAQIFVRGKPTDAWSIAALPSRLREELQTEATRQKFRDAETLLSLPVQDWQPAIPMAEIAQHCLDKAAKLQRSLLPAFERLNDLSLNAAEFERLGVEDYKRVFGFLTSTRHWRRLFERTIQRDNGAENWNRLELFLDDNPARNTESVASLPVKADSEFKFLHEVISCFRNPSAPNEIECRLLWLRSFEYLEQRVAAGKAPKKAKRALLHFLFRHAPSLASSANALRVSFERKYNRWITSNREASALIDSRGQKSGNWRAPALTKESRDKIIGHAVLNCGGSVSQAWRELFQGAGLDEQLLSYYRSNPANKSYMPTRIRQAVSAEVKLLEDIHHGPRQAKLNGAHVFRDWSGVYAGDWYQADDATLDVYYCEPDNTGGFRLMRGQCLLMIDLRSTRILGYALLSEKSYNARAIRTLITKVCDEHGLPSKGFYFERGIWESSRILKGDPNAEPFSWNETETGLREFGLRFVHSRLPRSKPVEGVIGAVQKLMKGERGYVGNDEMHNRFERVQKAKLLVQSNRLQPEGHFYTFDQWETRIAELCEKYNGAEQNGKMTGGLSPDDAFEKFRNKTDKQIRFDAASRYLLAHHKRPVKVTSNGITLRFGKQVFNYRNEVTGQLIGETVLAWFNPELPEVLAVTDMNRENPFCLARTQAVPAMDAPDGLLSEELARIEAHQRHARTRYRILKAQFSPSFRRNITDARTMELGQAIETQRAAAESQALAEQKQRARVRKVSRDLNLTLPESAMHRPETAPALDRLKELLQEPDDQSEVAQ